MSALLSPAILLVLAGVPSPQGPAGLERVHRLLASGAAADRARGAEAAARGGFVSAAPALATALAGAGDGPREDLVRHATLDALVRLDVAPPGLSLVDVPRALLPAALVLSSKDPRASLDGLRSLLGGDDLPFPEEVAVARTLAPLREPGVAFHLMRRLEPGFPLVVADPGSVGVGRGAASRTPAATFTVPEDFPAVARYELVLEGERGDVLLVPGDPPVFYRRHVVGPGESASVGGTVATGDEDAVRVSILARMAGRTPSDFVKLVRESFLHPYADEATFLETAIEERRATEEAFFRLAAALRDAALLTLDELAALRPSIETRVDDRRSERRPRLPEVPERAVRVRIGDVLWYERYDDAQRVARERGLPLLVHFGENPG